MTQQDASANSDVVTGTIRIHTLFTRAFYLGLTHSFVSISFAGLLGMPLASMYFDLICYSYEIFYYG